MGWVSIVRLGLVQSAIGAMVMLATSLLNRVMVVEYALPAALPAGLVAWHYAVQLSRPAWGHGSDKGRRRTPWIVGGMGMLALGSVLAVDTLTLLAARSWSGYALAIGAFAMIGAGVGAAGTSLLALLAAKVDPARRPAAAAITWIMMIAGIVVTAGIAGALIDPFSQGRLALVVGGVALAAFLVSLLAVIGVEGVATPVAEAADAPAPDMRAALVEMWSDAEARRFTVFVFVSMLAYSMQDMILEPFAGLLFGYTPGQSTQLSGVQHGGVLVGMILVGVGASAFGGRSAAGLRRWIFAGCVGSAVALAGLAIGARMGAAWPLAANIALLGFANGVFAVAAIGAMMSLAGAGGARREGIRMGVWGAAQAIAFGLGGLTGAAGVDALRVLIGKTDRAFTLVFAAEALLFLAAAALALRATGPRPAPRLAELAA
ncbi:Bacteriochlorophyll synthase 44.5 kDa chain [Sphingomonas sp. EC-HK361]|uniref:BCD family MFS transporter n=1 Tax=Sphingomonas sp. EC-HK361 TaxID=2038397 RepID=UPI0012531A53|nr:BCD family MFS transporter [Sphingomonas sp. EC-HK361]VVS99984.1 Bacteriochlorophyll synthase 44.5 kDa chain [Sphingomonas sp. EC-HK361]